MFQSTAYGVNGKVTLTLHLEYRPQVSRSLGVVYLQCLRKAERLTSPMARFGLSKAKKQSKNLTLNGSRFFHYFPTFLLRSAETRNVVPPRFVGKEEQSASEIAFHAKAVHALLVALLVVIIGPSAEDPAQRVSVCPEVSSVIYVFCLVCTLDQSHAASEQRIRNLQSRRKSLHVAWIRTPPTTTIEKPNSNQLR